jgi:hypothetical protein
VSDVLHILLGLCLYLVLFLPTSYAICLWAEPFEFSRRSVSFRLCVALAFSFAVTPYVLFLLYRWASPWLILVPAAAGLALMARRVRRVRWRHVKPALILLLAVICMTLAAVPDWTIGTKTYFSVAAWDYAKHVSVTHALSVDRVPPFNPSFAPGHPIRLFYYYFWFLSSSAVEVIGKGSVSARQAVIAGDIYNTLSLLATVTVSAWLLFPGPRRRKRARLYMALGLLLVSGLDLIPFLITVARKLVAGQLLSPGYLPGSLGWWNEQVTNWPATAMWVPHHVAAFLVLWMLFWESATEQEAPLSRRWALVLFRGMALVSIFGMSVWMGLLAGAIFGCWMVQQILRRNWRRVNEWVAAGFVAGVLVLPYAMDLHRAKMTHAATLAFSVRRFFPLQPLFGKLDALLQAAGARGFVLKLVHQGIFLLCLPLNYGMELGVLLLGVLLYWRYCRGTAWELRGGSAWWPLLVPCALVVTFVRSALSNNDLGWRAFLPLQLAMLLALVMVWERMSAGGTAKRWRPTVVVLGGIGLATTLCDVTLMRVEPMVDNCIGARGCASISYSRREAYRLLNASEPADWHVQHNPQRDVDFESGIFGDRKVVLADYTYGPLYGVDQKTYQGALDRIAPVFQDCGEGTEKYAGDVATEYQIRLWLFQKSDEVWRDRSCWIWSRPAFFRDAQVLIIPAK